MTSCTFYVFLPYYTRFRVLLDMLYNKLILIKRVHESDNKAQTAGKMKKMEENKKYII